MSEKKKLLVSFSGGRTSAYMLWYIFNEWPEREEWDKVVVFANTGREDSATLDFVHECSWRWKIPVVWVEARHIDENGNRFSPKGWKVKHQVVNYFTAAKCVHKRLTDGKWTWTPFEEMVSVLGIPNASTSAFCSDQLKRKAIESYLKSIGWKKKKYWKALGIRYDEPERIDENAVSKRIIYLIHDLLKSEYDVLAWWAAQEFDLKVKKINRNCDRCPKKDLPLLVECAEEEPESYDWWEYITQTYGNYDPRDIANRKGILPPFNFYRGNKSPSDIKAMVGMDKKEINKLAGKRSKCSTSCEPFN